MRDTLGLNGGYFTIEVIRDGPHGPVVRHRERVHNVVTTIGKKLIMKQAAGLGTAYLIDQIRIGVGSTAATSNDTNVKTAVAGTLTTVDTKTMSGQTYQVIHSYPSGGGTISCANIQEVALLSQATSPGGSCWARSTFTAVTKTVNDKLKITYEIQIT